MNRAYSVNNTFPLEHNLHAGDLSAGNAGIRPQIGNFIRMKKLSLFILVTAFVFNEISAAQQIYISPAGNDRNSGAKEQPLASLAGARDRIRQLREGKTLTDTVYVTILSGDYYLNEPFMLTEKDGGTAQSPVIYTGEATARPVFYGGLKLDKFEAVDDRVWRVLIPEAARYGFGFEQLYINGRRRFRAQTPDHGQFFRIRNVGETVLDKTGFASQKIKLNVPDLKLLSDLNAEGLGQIMITIHQKWTETRKYIQHVNPGDTSIYISGGEMAPWNSVDNKCRWFIENYRAALDSPGEWYLSRDGYLYYIPLEGETIENTKAMVPVTERFMVLSGDEDAGKRVEHLRFENLVFRVSGYKTPVQGNEPGQAASEIEAAVMVDFARHVEFVNCEIAQTGQYALWFRSGCSDALVSRCHIHDLGAGGIRIGENHKTDNASRLTNHITVDNNIIQHGGYVFPDGTGVIIFNASDNQITHNDIADFRYSGISVGWTWGYAPSPSKRNKIEFNHIHHLGWGELCDMGGVYTLGASEGTTVSNNVIHHIYSFEYGGWGLYTDEGSTGIVMENNLVYNCKDAGFHQHFGKENIIRNNIFAFNVRAQIALSRPEAHKSISFVKNIVYSDKGILLNDSYVKDSWLKAITDMDFNCYWDLRTPNPEFNKRSFTEWQKLGKDRHSIIADPLFKDPQNLDFHFKSLKAVKKTGFVPFDYTRAGVYGDENWKHLANLDPVLLQKFDEAVRKNSLNYAKTSNPEPPGWFAGDMHVHLDCNGPEAYSEDKLARLMEPNDLAVISVLADVGTGTMIDSKRDLPKVNGNDTEQSRPGRIIHWDTEWLWWDAENVQTLALGGHLALLGLKEAYYIGEETPWKVFEWSRKQNAVNGFVHMQYLNDSIQDELNCCMPIDYPVEAALGTLDFVSEDVYGRNSLNGGIYNSEAAIHAYYKLLNCGFRLGLAAGTDYPCNEFEPLGALLTYVKVQDELTYRKWIDGIKNGETVVSRNGHKEFIEFKVNGRYGPGADIKTGNKGSVDIEAKWTSVKEMTGRIELVKNGKVVATLEGTTKPGEPLVMKATAEFEQSGWLCARRMEDNEHMTHSAPVYVTVNNKPVRASAEDAQYFVSWIDNILENTAPGGKWNRYFTHDVNLVRQRYQKARDIYSNIAKESK